MYYSYSITCIIFSQENYWDLNSVKKELFIVLQWFYLILILNIFWMIKWKFQKNVLNKFKYRDNIFFMNICLTLTTSLNFRTTFHSHTDGQFEWVIQILKDILWCCVIEFEGSWEKFLLLAELTYNNWASKWHLMKLYMTVNVKLQLPLTLSYTDHPVKFYRTLYKNP